MLFVLGRCFIAQIREQVCQFRLPLVLRTQVCILIYCQRFIYEGLYLGHPFLLIDLGQPGVGGDPLPMQVIVNQLPRIANVVQVVAQLGFREHLLAHRNRALDLAVNHALVLVEG